MVGALLAAVLSSACASPEARLYPLSGAVFGLQPRGEPPAPVTLPARASEQEKFDALMAAWQGELDTSDTPGGAVAIIIDGQLAFARGVGFKRRGGDQLVNPDSLFRTASISKTVIAAAAMQLVQAGKLRLDEPITRVVPYFTRGWGNDASSVTLRTLLSHTAGLPDSAVSDCGVADQSARDYFTTHGNEPLWARPGEVFNYSNNNYALVAAAIDEVTGRPFGDVVTDSILRPAGMKTATFDGVAALALDHVDGHIGQTVVPPTPIECEPARAAGGVYASVTEFARLLQLLMAQGKGVLSPESVLEMQQPHAEVGTAPPSHYGYGLMIGQRGGTTVLSHSGGAAGIRSYFAYVPQRRFAVVAFVNSFNGPAPVWARALDVFLDLPDDPDVPAAPAGFDHYTGTYRDPVGWLGTVTVFREGDRLLLRLEGGQARPIPTQLTGTFLPGDGGDLLFVTRLGVARRH